MRTIAFTIFGAPVTKKNHMRLVKVRGRTIPIQSAPHDAWFRAAMPQARAAWAGMPPLDVPCSLSARFYRARNTGDLGNYLAALCDLLERAGIVSNDRLIQSFDGSRLLKDATNPRVDLTLEALQAVGIGVGGGE